MTPDDLNREMWARRSTPKRHDPTSEMSAVLVAAGRKAALFIRTRRHSIQADVKQLRQAARPMVRFVRLQARARHDARPGFVRSSAPTRAGPDDDPAEPEPERLTDDEAARIAQHVVEFAGERLTSSRFDAAVGVHLWGMRSHDVGPAKLAVFMALPQRLQAEFYSSIEAVA